MEVILLGIYSFFVWLIFIKLKLLPWTTPWKVAVAIIPVVALATMLLLLNIFAPTTTDVRVVKYVVPIVSGVRGRVIDVPVENNRPVTKGDVLFRIDPTPYEITIRSLEADLLSNQAMVTAELAKLGEAEARLPDAVSSERQLTEQLNQATGQIGKLQASLELAMNVWPRTRSSQTPAPGIASIWSRRRQTSRSSPRKSPRPARPSRRSGKSCPAASRASSPP
jgi:multidrug resistance efflux pump